jgi:hypothetical protein
MNYTVHNMPTNIDDKCFSRILEVLQLYFSECRQVIQSDIFREYMRINEVSVMDIRSLVYLFSTENQYIQNVLWKTDLTGKK